MKSKAIYIALISIFCAFSACKKSDDETVPSIPMIKMITFYRADTIAARESYQYDHSGRISKRTHSSGYSETYSYEARKILKEMHQEGSLETYTDTLYLNDRGLVISDQRGQVSYQYNPQGYLEKSIIAGNNKVVLYYAIKDENTIEMTKGDDSPFQVIEYIDNFLFSPSLINTIGNENRGISFYGKQNKNLKLDKFELFVPDHYAVRRVYAYEFDALNRVTKSSYADNPDHIYTLYTYYN